VLGGQNVFKKEDTVDDRIEEKTPEIFKNLPSVLQTKLAFLRQVGMTSIDAFDSLSEEEKTLIEQTVESVIPSKEAV
jgi:hypothetical protein